MGTARIREFEERDLTPCEALLAASIRAEIANFHWVPPGREALEADWRLHRGEYPWLSVELDGRWAGFAAAYPYKSRAAYRWTAETGIYLEARARGKGYGRHLYQGLLDSLTARGFRSAVAGIALPGEASSGLHAALGFRRVGVFREVGWKQGEWRDVALWQRSLSKRAESSQVSDPS